MSARARVVFGTFDLPDTALAPRLLDRFYAGGGDDTLQPVDSPAVKDVVNCGPGTDKVYADEADAINDNCERVVVR